MIPKDLKEFLKLLNSHKVEYLLVGGHAVGYHGYPRATGDMDIWIACNEKNAQLVANVLVEFGFDIPGVDKNTFLQKNKIFRMGNIPVRIELLTTISGVEFYNCYKNRIEDEIDGVPVKIINLNDLIINKRASGRNKDLDDLEKLNQF